MWQKEDFTSSWYKTEILQPLRIDTLLDRHISELSGGELQKLAIAACLTKDADVYYIDEPSSFLDVKQRLNMAKATRMFLRLVW
jgi:ATP-binding cassette subfamily E protein 1